MSLLSCLLGLFALAAAATAASPNEVGSADADSQAVGLARAAGDLDAVEVTSMEAKAAIAQMTGDVLKQEEQLNLAKSQIEKLQQEEKAEDEKADQLDEKVSRMQEDLKNNGGVSDAAQKAKTETQKLQDELLQDQSEIESLGKEINAKTFQLQSGQDKLVEVKKRVEANFNDAKHAVERNLHVKKDLHKAQAELENQKRNLSQQTLMNAREEHRLEAEASRKRSVAKESVNLLREKAEAEATKEWSEEYSETGLVHVQQELEDSKQRIKDMRRAYSKHADAHEHELELVRQQGEAQHNATTLELKKVKDQIVASQHKRQKTQRDQEKVYQSVQDSKTLKKQKEAQEDLAPMRLRLKVEEDAVARQVAQNKVHFAQSAAATAAMQAKRDAAVATMKNHIAEKKEKLRKMQRDNRAMLESDRSMRDKVWFDEQKLKTAEREETQLAMNVTSALATEKKRLDRAKEKFQALDEKNQQAKAQIMSQIESEHKAESDQMLQEVQSLKTELKQVHKTKNAKVTELNHQLEHLQSRNARLKLRGRVTFD